MDAKARAGLVVLAADGAIHCLLSNRIDRGASLPEIRCSRKRPIPQDLPSPRWTSNIRVASSSPRAASGNPYITGALRAHAIAAQPCAAPGSMRISRTIGNRLQ
jgi:hypothetical protein